MSLNVFVTGGAGYIGSHASKALRKAGFNPITIDGLVTGWKDAVKFGPFEQMNLLQKDHIHQQFKKYNPVAVMHFAALSNVGESVIKPKEYWHNNLFGSLNLIEAALENNCNNFIFSSTCAVYGQQDVPYFTEKSPVYPNNAYASSKRAVEEILKNYSAISDLKYYILRYFNVAGADKDAEIGEYHRPETHLIPLLLNAMTSRRRVFKIYGVDYDTHDGTCIRDYLHVEDLVQAHMLSLSNLLNGADSEVINLGTGSGYSVKEVISAAQEVTGLDVAIYETDRRPGDVSRLVSGSDLALQKLKWVPTKSSLREMISDAWRWHKVGEYLR